MARRRYRRYRRKTGKWSSNITKVSGDSLSVPGNGDTYTYVELCTNPVQSVGSVSQQYTVKNVFFNFTIDGTGNAFYYVEGLVGYIMFLPQGMPISYDFPKQHPEYIMGMRYYGSPEKKDNGQIKNPLGVSTRLARRLNTGDKIIFLLQATNTGSVDTNISVNGVVRWWTKAN